MFGEMIDFISSWRERHHIEGGKDLTNRQMFRLEKDVKKYITKLYKKDKLMRDKKKSPALVYPEERAQEGVSAWAIARKKEESSGGKEYSLYHTDPYAFQNDQNVIEAVKRAVNNNPIALVQVMNRMELPEKLSGVTFWWYVYNGIRFDK